MAMWGLVDQWGSRAVEPLGEAVVVTGPQARCPGQDDIGEHCVRVGAGAYSGGRISGPAVATAQWGPAQGPVRA